MLKIISNTSCLIVLDNINMLSILKELYKEIYITQEVYSEFGKNIENWIKIKNVKDDKYIKILNTFIDLGEASTLALSFELRNSLIILDDLKARKIAQNMNLKFTGTLGVILKAIANNFIVQADIAFKCGERLIKVSEKIIKPKLLKNGINNFLIRVAIDSGNLVPILIKTPQEFKSIPDLVGRAMNRLSKICNQAEPNQILIGDDYFGLIHGNIQDRFIKSSKKAKYFENYLLWEINIHNE